MANGLTIQEVEKYVNIVIPNIEKELANDSMPNQDKLELYNLYVDVLRIVAPYNFPTFNKYLELDDDHNSPTKAFYYHRKDALKDVFESLNDMEMYDKYDILLISMPPRVGKTTSGIRFLSWIIGKYPEETQMATSYSDNITTSFYIGVMEIVQSDRYKEVFSDAPLVAQNAKREEIWLKALKRYPSITFVPIGGSMTGRCEASKYMYCDDLVSGLEEALSKVRLDKLWGLYTVNAKQRKLDGAKEIHVATKWSVHDVITKLGNENKNNSRCKIIDLSCYDENGESRFDYVGGFSTKYYKDLEESMDSASFGALYKQEPIEREGILYNEEDLQYYFELPSDRPDSIISVCDSKNLGNDFVSSPIGYVYGDLVFIEDVVFNSGLPDVTKQLVANKWVEHKVVRADVEMNNGGNYYAEGVDGLVKQQAGRTSVRMFFSSNNKQVKIITYSDYVKKHFVFKSKSMYSKNSDYAVFMKNLTTWTQTGKNDHDDAPDSIAMLAQLIQDMENNSIKILDRRELKL